MKLCPCQSKKSYELCCQPYHLGQIKAQTPEILMRSRYSAFVLGGLGEYLLNTWFHTERSQFQLKELNQKNHYYRLDILSSQTKDQLGEVEFKAYYVDQNKIEIMHEKSIFINENQEWFYVKGTYVPTIPKLLQKNELCPCGSGLKYKACQAQ
jgi:SEC-C motif-containing protein